MNARSEGRLARRGYPAFPDGRVADGHPGPRALVPPPANDNRAPPLTRLARAVALAAGAAAILWTAANLLGAGG